MGIQSDLVFEVDPLNDQVSDHGIVPGKLVKSLGNHTFLVHSRYARNGYAVQTTAR